MVLPYPAGEPEARRRQEAAGACRRGSLAGLRLLDAHLQGREFLCDGRFTIADIAIGFALFLGQTLGMAGEYAPQTQAYLARLMDRPAFQRALAR